jgi:hypothetical protein
MKMPAALCRTPGEYHPSATGVSTTQILDNFELLVQEETFADALLTGMVS